MLERIPKVVQLAVYTRHWEKSIVKCSFLDIITVWGYVENDLFVTQRQYFEFVVDTHSMWSTNCKRIKGWKLIYEHHFLVWNLQCNIEEWFDSYLECWRILQIRVIAESPKCKVEVFFQIRWAYFCIISYGKIRKPRYTFKKHPFVSLHDDPIGAFHKYQKMFFMSRT